MSAGVWLALGIGVVIIAVLGVVAYRELAKVKAQQDKVEAARVERAKNLQVSVDLIARATLSEQCDVSEASLRLQPLLSVVDPNWTSRSDLRPIMTLAEALADQPIKDARKSLTKQERMKLDLKRMKLEAEHAEGVKKACEVLVRGDS